MSLFNKSVAVFDKYDAETFREPHHKDFTLHRNEAINLDQNCEMMNGMCKNSNFPPLKNAELILKNDYKLEMLWEEKVEIVTNLSLKKVGLYWNAMVNRIPIQD